MGWRLLPVRHPNTITIHNFVLGKTIPVRVCVRLLMQPLLAWTLSQTNLWPFVPKSSAIAQYLKIPTQTSNPNRKLIIKNSRDVLFWDLSSYSHVKKKKSNLICSGQPEHCRLKFIHCLIVIALGFWKKLSCRYYVENYVETCDFRCGKLDIHLILL